MDAQDERDSERKVRFNDAVSALTVDSEEEPIMTDIGVIEYVGHRLYEQGRQKKAEFERRQKLLEQAELRKLKKESRPTTTDGERRYPTFESLISEQMTWKKSMDIKLKTKQDKKREEDEQEDEILTKPWQMDKTSSDIISRKLQKGLYEGPQAGWKSNFSKYIKTKNAESPPPEEFEPTINTMSKQMVREGSAHERLYAQAAEREESLMLLRAWENDKSMIDPETGAPRFQPKILSSTKAEVHFENSRLRNSQQHPDSQSVSSSFSKRRSFNELMEHLHNRPSEHRMASVSQDPPCSFTPQTNPTSALILEKAGPRPPLYQPVSSLMAWRDRSVSPQPPRYRSKTPDEKQRIRDRHKAFMARQLKDVLEKESRKQGLMTEIERKELQGCTFHPQISRRSEEIFNESKYAKIGKDVQYVTRAPQRRVKKSEDRSSPEPESSTAAFIRKLEEDQARDREAGVRARRARSASPNRPPTPPRHPYTPKVSSEQQARDPSPLETPGPSPSPFLNTLQSELKNVIEGWKEFDL